MKITVRINEFKRVLEEARFVVPKEPAEIPVYAYVKVEVDDAKRATLSATDRSMSLTQTFEVVDGDAGSLLLPAKKVQDFLKGHVDGTATIETTPDDAQVIVKAGTFAIKFSTFSPSHFPAIEAMPDVQFVISLKFLIKLLTQVESACPSMQGKQSVAAIQLESNATRLRAVASDGNRIAIAEAGAGAGDFTVQLPKTMLPIVKRRKGTTFQFAQSETNMFLRTESVVFQIRIPVSKFPSYQKVLALDGFKGKVTVASADLKAALKNLRSAISETTPGVVFKFGSGNLQLTALTTDDGKETATGSGSLEVETEGEPGTFKVNPRFVLDALSQMEGKVEIHFIHAITLVLFSAGNVRHFVMPLLPDEPKKILLVLGEEANAKRERYDSPEAVAARQAKKVAYDEEMAVRREAWRKAKAEGKSPEEVREAVNSAAKLRDTQEQSHRANEAETVAELEQEVDDSIPTY